MCRNIKTLFNFEPPATDDEIHDASLQFVRKLSGFTIPSKANQAAFDQASGPKELLWLDAEQHIDLYDTEPFVTQAADATARFLSER